MDKKQANQALVSIYGALQTLPVNGEQNIGTMMNIFQALVNLMGWINTFPDIESGDSNDGENS